MWFAIIIWSHNCCWYSSMDCELGPVELLGVSLLDEMVKMEGVQGGGGTWLVA